MLSYVLYRCCGSVFYETSIFVRTAKSVGAEMLASWGHEMRRRPDESGHNEEISMRAPPILFRSAYSWFGVDRPGLNNFDS